VLITELPVAQQRSGALDCHAQAEWAEYPQSVRLHRDPGSGGVPRSVAFDEFGFAALSVEGGGQSEPGNSAADN
jgi:hypothetical protein